MRLVLILASLALAVPALADDCSRAMNQNAMNRCAEADYQAADARLNAVYSRLMNALDDRGFKAKLISAQRAWIQFRDAECASQTADNEGGSIHPMVFAGCRTRLTVARIKDLEAQLTCWRNAEKCGM